VEHLKRLEAIDKEIASIMDALDVKKELITHLSIIDHKRKRLKDKVNKLYAFVDKEQAKFEELESTSVVSLFYKVLGVYEGRYEQEEQDFVDAALNYNAALDQLHLIDFELRLVKKKLVALESKELNVDELLAEKQQLFNVYDAVVARDINKFDSLLYTNRRQVSQAYNLINKIEIILKDLRYILRAVVETGRWILSNQGSKYFLPYKYNKQITLASRAATRAQNNIDNFNVLVKNYAPKSSFQKIYINEYLSKLFDQLIKDWVAHYYFKSSENGLREDIGKLENLSEDLHKEIKELNLDSENLLAEKKQYLIKL